MSANRRYISSVFALAATVIFTTCIDPSPYTTPVSNQILTVDGLISTAAGPHEIRLTYANQYSNQALGNRILARNAHVYITDESGNETYLKEEVLTGKWVCIPGWYYETSSLGRDIVLPTGRYFTPPGFCASVGSTYTLHIATQEGKKYLSNPETVVPMAKLETLGFRPYSEGSINPLINNTGVELMVSFNDNPATDDQYYWRLSKGHIQLQTEPHLARGTPPSCCETCYMHDLDALKLFNTSNDVAFNGLETRQPIIRIADNGLRFKSRYRAQVDQYAVSKEAYQFLRLVRQQLDIQGSVFDPPPANIRGNMRNVENPDEQVLGYFMAADVSSQMIYINRSDIPPQYHATRKLIPDDCRNYCGLLHEPPTIAPPADWEYN